MPKDWVYFREEFNEVSQGAAGECRLLKRSNLGWVECY